MTYCCDGEPEQWVARGHAVIVKEGMRIQVKDVPAGRGHARAGRA